MGAKNNSLISTQIITASLTMITVIGAFAVFIIEKREIGFWYYIIVGLAFLSFIMSIIFGGIGLGSEEAEDDYNIYFNWQTRLAILGIILFCTSIFFGKEKPNDLRNKINNQEKNIIQLQTKDEFRAKKIQQLTEELEDLSNQIEEMKKDTVPNNVYKKLPK